MSEKKIELGKIVKAVGIKGEVKLLSFSDDPHRFSKLNYLIIDENESKLENARVKDRQPIIKIEGIDDRNNAEESIGKLVYIWEKDLEELPPGQYYIKDLIGCIVIDEALGELGFVEDVLTDRPQQLYKVKSEKYGEILFPWVKEFIVEVELNEKRIVVKLPNGLVDI